MSRGSHHGPQEPLHAIVHFDVPFARRERTPTYEGRSRPVENDRPEQLTALATREHHESARAPRVLDDGLNRSVGRTTDDLDP